MENKEFQRYNNKAMSVRLQDDALIFFLKYAQQTGADNISDTFKTMLDELQQYHDLESVELKETVWGNDGMSTSFLKAADKENRHRELLVLNPMKLSDIPEPEPEEEEDTKDDDEDVFTI